MNINRVYIEHSGTQFACSTLNKSMCLFSAGRQFLPLSGLSMFVDSLGPGILVHATSNGDTAAVQAYLDKNPDQVCIYMNSYVLLCRDGTNMPIHLNI